MSRFGELMDNILISDRKGNALYNRIFVVSAYGGVTNLLLEDKKTGALAALVTSWRITKGRALGLFRLDLSFWWFYGLQALTLLVCYFDLIASALGISLPLPADIASLLFYVLYAALTLLLYRQFGSYLHTSYAVAYDTLRYQAAMPTPKPQDSEAE